MYSLSLQRDFRARHFLIGGDWGVENSPHAHDYRVEVRLQAEGLDAHGFLVDLVDLQRSLDDLVETFRDRMLNDLPDFKGLNPSLENFARIFHKQLGHRLPQTPPSPRLEVRIWEDSSAWAGYHEPR